MSLVTGLFKVCEYSETGRSPGKVMTGGIALTGAN